MRINEDAVDLNRNFVDFSQQLPSSTGYEALHDYLVPPDWLGERRRNADLALEGKPCRVYVAPFDVRLPKSTEEDDQIDTVVQLDVREVIDPVDRTLTLYRSVALTRTVCQRRLDSINPDRDIQIA